MVGREVALALLALSVLASPVLAQEATPAGASVCQTLLATPVAREGEPLLTEAGGTPVFANVMRGFDVMFLDLMIPYHEAGVAMAQIAQERAAHADLREQAQGIVQHHREELEQLRAWRSEWSPHVPAMPPDEAMGLLTEMMANMPGMEHDPELLPRIERGREQRAMIEELCTATGPFDAVFIDKMIRHHEGEIALAQLAPQHSAHPELLAFVQAVVEEKGEEIKLLTAWRQLWYGGTPTAG